MQSSKKYISGIRAFINQLKVIAIHNRVNELLLVVEFTKNKYNPLAFDAHVKSIFDTTTHKKLNWPTTIPRICYQFSIELQPEWKLYKFVVSPLSLKHETDTELLNREEAIGQYGNYFKYSFSDAVDDLKELGDIEL